MDSLFDGKVEVKESGGQMNGAEAMVLSLKVSTRDSILVRAVSARKNWPIGVMVVRRVSGKGNKRAMMKVASEIRRLSTYCIIV